jgi:hypothetical protein
MTHPPWFTLEDQLRGPAIGHAFGLRSGEAVNISAMLCDENEVAQIPHDEMRFVVCPYGAINGLNARLGWEVIYLGEVGRVEEKLLRVQKRRIAHLFLLYRSRASGLKGNQDLICRR